MLHTTAQWNKILISDMTDTHLDNTINFLIKNIESLENLYFWKQEENINTLVSWYTSWNIDKQSIIEKIQELNKSLSLYIMEWNIRWKEYSERLQELYKRKEWTKIQSMYENTSIKKFDYYEKDYEANTLDVF